MKTLIIYASHAGYTRECAEKIASYLVKEATILDIENMAADFNVEPYAKIIIGSYVHAGRIASKIKRFLKKYQPLISQKKIAFFLSCLSKDNFGKYLRQNIPTPLLNQALSKTHVGAAVYYEKLNPLERFMLKKITGRNQSFSVPENDNIRRFAEEIANL